MAKKPLPSKPRSAARHQPVKLPTVWQLSRQTAELLWRHKRLFGGITLVYAIANLLLVRGFSSGRDLAALKSGLQAAFGNGALASSWTVFGVLVGSGNNGATSADSGGYQVFLILIASLAAIWALREVLAGNRIRLRDAFYRGMYPLIPFLLVLAVICLQLIPLAAGAALYNTIVTNGIAVNAFEKLLWAGLFGVLALLSLYMVSASVFGLYIVSLPEMTPLRALRSARELVRRRRWTVLRKVVALPFILIIITAVIMLPIIMLVTPLAQWVFYVLTMCAGVVVHTYLYGLYRELLHE